MKKNYSLTEKLDSIAPLVHTADMFRADFPRCGKHMKEVEKHFDIKPFYHEENFIKCTYGLKSVTVKNELTRGNNTIKVDCIDYFRKGKKVLIYNIDNRIYEFNTIDEVMGNCLILSSGLKHDYPEGSNIVVIREIEYKLYPIRGILKRRIDRNRFKTVTRKVTDLFILYYEHSKIVMYRLKVCNAKIESHVFL